MTGEAELRLRERLSKLKNAGLLRGARVSGEVDKVQRQLDRIEDTTPSDEEIWRSVELARHQDRPYTLDYVDRLFDDFFQLRGDRFRADDEAIVAGLAKFDGRTIAVVGQQKGRDLKERTKRNFGMAYPEGYRKAMRTMQLAGTFGFPVITLVDTPGAYPGVAAEQHGQGGAIARSQAVMLRLGIPTVACVIGEGGSGGAIALAVADRVLMQEHAIYSVISPEGCAAILWRDGEAAQKAAAAFKPDAAHCLELGVIDGIVPEPAGGAQTDHDEAARLLGDSIREALEELDGTPGDELKRRRRARFRSLGVFA
ncbi:MAG: acetyl-CoA carboxylase carboxyl transferase subunit alpha [Gaiellaceae bacterium]|nr:acetyl-CoA carboxylase carboxyl transferase subunit alpha [Gaiellaceae bacterium]